MDTFDTRQAYLGRIVLVTAAHRFALRDAATRPTGSDASATSEAAAPGTGRRPTLASEAMRWSYVLRSRDRGRTWESIAANLPERGFVHVIKEDPAREGSPQEEDAEAYWNTTLRLSLPSLGGVEAKLHLTPAGVAVRLIADSEATRSTLDVARQRLADALDAANVPLTGLVAERRSTP